MPRQYEHIRDSYLRKGVSEKEAKKLGAMTYNKLHPGHPMSPKHEVHMNRGGKMVRPIAPRLPKALASQPAPNAMAGPAAGPAAPSPPSGRGMKRGGKLKMAKGGVVPKTVKTPPDETKERKWPLKGEAKDAKGEKVAMKRGGAVKKYASGGAVRGDGIAERGRTRGTFR
jgi:hypothetical protein